MKKISLTSCLLLAACLSYGQFGGIKNKINEKVNQKIDQEIDKGFEKATEKPDKNKNKDAGNNDAGSDDSSSENSSATSGDKTAPATFSSYSKFDFIPGDKVIAFEDFSSDNVGDFPAKWNTDGSGEIVTVSSATGKWFAMGESGYYRPDYLKMPLPDNFTLEFDVIFNKSTSGDTWYFMLGNAKEDKDLSPERYGIQFQFVTSGKNYITVSNWCYLEDCSGVTDVSNTSNISFSGSGEKVRVSVWRQKQRIRLYINETKAFDLPRALDIKNPINCINFRSYSIENPKHAFVSNIRVAVGAPDTRSKLITEGKFVTSGILFDVGSDKIKPESYGVLKDISNVLKENADVKVKIVGHTDSDGDDAKNLELSAKRAASVKNILYKEFGIDESRMQTEGKGETQPVAPNTTPEGKANNRRVEFVKM